MRQFESGAVRDDNTGKGRFDLIPFEIIAHLCANQGDRFLSYLSFFKDEPAVRHLDQCIITLIQYWHSPHQALLDLARHAEEGAKKYGEDNWQKGIPLNVYVDSAARHYCQWRTSGDRIHLTSCLWNVICARWTFNHRKD